MKLVFALKEASKSRIITGQLQAINSDWFEIDPGTNIHINMEGV